MKKIIILFCFLPFASSSQNNDTAAIQQTIQKIFDGMRKGDSTLVRSTFHSGATLQSIYKNKSGETKLKQESPDEFIKAVGTPHQEVWNEMIWSHEIRIDGDMATVWAPYSFFADDVFSHCGINAFTLARISGTWIITSITDTRRREPCRTK